MATDVATTHLPKYVQNANRILETLAQEPEKAWTKTQRELGVKLGLSQPELSTLLKMLFEQNKIRKGASLPGVRGKNYVIELIDEALLDRPVSRRRSSAHEEDRALRPDETMSGITDLGQIDMEKLGLAVTRSLRDSWEQDKRHREQRAEQQARIREYREDLSEERRLRSQLVTDKENLERRVHELEHVQTELRAEINKLLLTTGEKPNRSGYQIKDLLPEDSLHMLENLMRGRPGNYRESDEEVGVASNGT